MRATHTIKFGAIMAAALFSTGAMSGQAARADEGAPVVSVAPPEAHHPFVETGRIGLIGALTEDMWKGGVVYEKEHFEAQLLAHAGLGTGSTRDVHIILKVGGRMPLGTLNYFAFGGEFGPHPGSKDNGVSVGRSFQTGPYISLERYFAATPVMLCLWVNPVQYDHSYVNDGAGNAVKDTTVRVFQTGGFGLSYLF